MTAALPRDAEEYLSWLEVERGRSPRTLAAYRRDLGTYQQDVEERGHDIDEATSRDVAAHLAALRRTHNAASVARALSSIRGFHRFLVEEGVRDDDPTLDLPSISVTDLLPKALSEEETERLLGSVVGTGPMVLRDRALLEVLYGTGARVSEVRRAEPRRRRRRGRGHRPARSCASSARGTRSGSSPWAGSPATRWPSGCRARGGRCSSRRSGAVAATPRPCSSTPVGVASPGWGSSGS